MEPCGHLCVCEACAYQAVGGPCPVPGCNRLVQGCFRSGERLAQFVADGEDGTRNSYSSEHSEHSRQDGMRNRNWEWRAMFVCLTMTVTVIGLNPVCPCPPAYERRLAGISQMLKFEDVGLPSGPHSCHHVMHASVDSRSAETLYESM